MLEIINQRYMLLLFEISKKPYNVSGLAKKGDLDISATSTLVSRWAKEGLLTKEKSESGRGNDLIIQLTEYGKEQIKILEQLHSNYKKNKNSNKVKREVKNGQIN